MVQGKGSARRRNQMGNGLATFCTIALLEDLRKSHLFRQLYDLDIPIESDLPLSEKEM